MSTAVSTCPNLLDYDDFITGVIMTYSAERPVRLIRGVSTCRSTNIYGNCGSYGSRDSGRKRCVLAIKKVTNLLR